MGKCGAALLGRVVCVLEGEEIVCFNAPAYTRTHTYILYALKASMYALILDISVPMLPVVRIGRHAKRCVHGVDMDMGHGAQSPFPESLGLGEDKGLRIGVRPGPMSVAWELFLFAQHVLLGHHLDRFLEKAIYNLIGASITNRSEPGAKWLRVVCTSGANVCIMVPIKWPKCDLFRFASHRCHSLQLIPFPFFRLSCPACPVRIAPQPLYPSVPPSSSPFTHSDKTIRLAINSGEGACADIMGALCRSVVFVAFAIPGRYFCQACCFHMTFIPPLTINENDRFVYIKYY